MKTGLMVNESNTANGDYWLEILQERLDNGLEESLINNGQLVAEAPWGSEGPASDPFVVSSEPLVMRQRVLHWEALQKWTFQYLRETYGTVCLPEDAHAIYPRECLLSELLSDVESGKSYLKDWWFQDDAPQLLDDLDIPSEFHEDVSQRLFGFRIMHLWAGGPKTKTRVHQDEPDVHVWSAQVSGVKRWTLFPPNFLKNWLSHGANDVNSLQQFAYVSGKVVTLLPGDVLLVPHKWFHSVRTLETGISVNAFHVTPDLLAPYLWTLMSWPLYFVEQVDGMLQSRPEWRSYMFRRANYLRERGSEFLMQSTKKIIL